VDISMIRFHVRKIRPSGSRRLWIIISLILFFFNAPPSFAGPYSPPAGEKGSSAIHMDDLAFIGWANGYTDYQAGSHVDAVWQTPENALGKAGGTSYDIVSLGRGGRITMTFDPPIANGEGWDFAIFENAVNNYHLELGYVEVSSNGIDFLRFDSNSLTPGPVSAFGTVDATLINGLAGKYRQGYGTPFDLSALAEKSEAQSGLVDLLRISHVRIIDITGDGSCFDSEGNVIYDPYPTVGSAGFDLDAIGLSNGAPFPEGENANGSIPPEKEGEAGFGGQSGCFIETIDHCGNKGVLFPDH